MEKFIGGPLIPTLTKLLLACVLVGLVLALFDIEPYYLWENFFDTVIAVWDRALDFVDWSVKYIVIGAIIVLPIWLVARFWAVFFERGSRKDSDA